MCLGRTASAGSDTFFFGKHCDTLVSRPDLARTLVEAPSSSFAAPLQGYVRHEQEGPRYVYSPGIPKTEARRSALEQVVHTFFGGSVEETAVALLGMSRKKIAPDVLERLSKMAERSSREGK